MNAFLIFVFTGMTIILYAGVAAAQSDRDVRIESGEARRLVVPAGKLMRVDEGVFDLKIGRSIDLTNRRVLLSIQYRRDKNC